jgi:hypothetical protein
MFLDVLFYPPPIIISPVPRHALHGSPGLVYPFPLQAKHLIGMLSTLNTK